MSERPPDPDSLRYARYWEPVLAGAARQLLSRIPHGPATYLDVGAGTGALALAAAVRWSQARIVALDASVGMLSVARERAARNGSVGSDRFTWLPADAADMPIDDGTVDVATSAFMLQLVDDRAAVLREIRRVLRPGGLLGVVSWLADELVLDADAAFADAVAGLGLEAGPEQFRPSRPTDFETVEAAYDELAAVGFEAIEARPEELRYSWTREAYLGFKEHFDERDLFEALDEPGREQLREGVRSGWAGLPDEAFLLRAPLVSALARR